MRSPSSLKCSSTRSTQRATFATCGTAQVIATGGNAGLVANVAFDAARDVRDEPGIAACGDHLCRPAHLGAHPADEAVHQTGVTVDRTRLEVGRGVAADRLFRPRQLDPDR